MLPDTTVNHIACAVAVIGGGPAGATVATLLAQQGHLVHLFERDHFPRFHIGESLMPETYWTFQRLGLLDQLKSGPFIKKYSVQFVSDNGQESAPFYFADNNPHECSQTWQVVRSEFDQLLLDNAAKQGVYVHQGARVTEVLFEGKRAVGLRVRDDDNRTAEVRAQVVVDASGQSSLLAQRLKLRQPDPWLRKASVWTYYRGAKREPGMNEGATLVLATEGKKGWFWYIPQHNDIVSVGVVSGIDDLFATSRDQATIFTEQVERCPAVKSRIAGAERTTGFFTTKDFSYSSSQVAGDGWVLVGDAFGFLDPIYSSGVFLALKSGEMAADAIDAGLKNDDTTAARLGTWGPEFLKGMGRMRRLVYAFYEGLSFGRFIRRYPHCKRHITDLLIGDLFKDEVEEVVEPLETMLAEIRDEKAADTNNPLPLAT